MNWAYQMIYYGMIGHSLIMNGIYLFDLSLLVVTILLIGALLGLQPWLLIILYFDNSSNGSYNWSIQNISEISLLHTLFFIIL
jgi:hypothetical protein